MTSHENAPWWMGDRNIIQSIGAVKARIKEVFEIVMQDVYDFFFDVNALFLKKGLPRLDDEIRPAIMSGLLSGMLTASLAKHSRSLTQNRFFNGHPDLIVSGRYPNNKIKSGIDGVEIKTTRKKGGAVDTHGARDQWMCAFVYETDHHTEVLQHIRGRLRVMSFAELVPEVVPVV
ncbi:MAG: hypothetical protein K8H87_11405, partial [Pseudorhodoplanes sp.]|nr:hypothetical protein [Pseudorhodoplanes sp.]